MKHTVTYCHLPIHPKHYHHQQSHKETKYFSPIVLNTVSFIPSHKNNTLNTFKAYQIHDTEYQNEQKVITNRLSSLAM